MLVKLAMAILRRENLKNMHKNSYSKQFLYNNLKTLLHHSH